MFLGWNPKKFQNPKKTPFRQNELSREKKNKQEIVAFISCFTGHKHFAQIENSPPAWEEGPLMFCGQIFLVSLNIMQNFTALGKSDHI